MTSQNMTARLLPWSSVDGKPCFLVSDGGHVSRVADTIESVQLGMAGGLVDHAADALADRKATPDELRFLAARLIESLREVHRIAESRGARLAEPDDDPDALEPNDGDDDQGGPTLPAEAFG